AHERRVLDGGVVAFDERGRPNFQRLQPRIHSQRPLDVARLEAEIPVVYAVFDVLQIGERDLRDLPLRARKALLMKLVRGSGVLRAVDYLEGEGRLLLEFCKKEGIEGLVSKRLESPYRSGPRRSDDWIKLKCEREADF